MNVGAANRANIPSSKNINSRNPRSGCKNPRTSHYRLRARGACDSARKKLTRDKELSPASRAHYFLLPRSWGSASLHPRLYAHAALRGLKSSFATASRLMSYLSISPRTISSVPMIATTSATRWPMHNFFKACRFMKHGGRTRTRQGCCVPSETR
jgi:hypothetical protein